MSWRPRAFPPWPLFCKLSDEETIGVLKFDEETIGVLKFDEETIGVLKFDELTRGTPERVWMCYYCFANSVTMVS